MPSSRITGQTLDLSRFDVVGVIGPNDVVTHVGLAEPGGIHKRSRVPVVDMAPPLRGPSKGASLVCGGRGTADLTDDEQRKIGEFINRHEGEHAAYSLAKRIDMIAALTAMYRAHPHAEDYYENGRRVRTLFSCAGFVYEAYRFAKIPLLDPLVLPLVGIEVISSCYGNQLKLLESHGTTKDHLGLVGPGPWPVMFCGYLLHSLSRSAVDIRRAEYSPSAEHIRF